MKLSCPRCDWVYKAKKSEGPHDPGRTKKDPVPKHLRMPECESVCPGTGKPPMACVEPRGEVSKYVCPLCFAKCPLFKRLGNLTFESKEAKSRDYSRFHKNVCPTCKKIKCKGTDEEPCQPKAMPRGREFPEWWVVEAAEVALCES